MADLIQPQPGVERIQRANTLTIRVEGREGHDAGVPLSTFLTAMRQTLGLLEDLERELTEGRETLDWRIIAASYTNPLSVVIEGRSKNLGQRPQPIVDELIRGVRDLEQGREPARFTDHSLRNVHRWSRAISQDGISSCVLEVPDIPPVSLTEATARNVTRILKRRVYYEISTLEGVLQTIDLHGEQNNFGIFDILTAERTLCLFHDSMLGDVVACLGQRVSVEGRVKFNRQGVAQSIEVDSFEVMPRMEDLPQFDKGERVNITDGISSEDYVRRLRDAE